eukprot:scaffold99706_cov18-Prasinocladus_malaysianus.AAC.1
MIVGGAAAPWTPPKVLASLGAKNKGKKNYPKAYVLNKPQAAHCDSATELVTKHENNKWKRADCSVRRTRSMQCSIKINATYNAPAELL